MKSSVGSDHVRRDTVTIDERDPSSGKYEVIVDLPVLFDTFVSRFPPAQDGWKVAAGVQIRRVGDAENLAIYRLCDSVVAAVALYDKSKDHDPTHNGVLNHDCIRCNLLKVLGRTA